MKADDPIAIGMCANENYHNHNQRLGVGCRPPVGAPWLDMLHLRDAEVTEDPGIID